MRLVAGKHRELPCLVCLQCHATPRSYKRVHGTFRFQRMIWINNVPAIHNHALSYAACVPQPGGKRRRKRLCGILLVSLDLEGGVRQQVLQCFA